jgi:hypothetical protein
MNGARAELWANTISAPNNNMTTMIGNSQNFFRIRIKAQSSDNNDNIGLHLLQSVDCV